MKYFNLLSGFLSGKKTIIVACLMIILGYLNQDKSILLEGIGFLTLRAGISKISK